MAGFIDGEGSIILWSRNGVASLKLVISNTNFTALNTVHRLTGIGFVARVKSRNKKHSDGGMWVCGGEGAVSVLKQIRDELVIKHEQADLAIETIERMKDRKLKGDRTWQMEAVNRMRELNKRGPIEPSQLTLPS